MKKSILNIVLLSVLTGVIVFFLITFSGLDKAYISGIASAIAVVVTALLFNQKTDKK